MVKPGFQEWGLMTALVFLVWGAISVPFIVADDVARVVLVTIIAGVVAFAPKLLWTPNQDALNQDALNRIKSFGDLSGGLLVVVFAPFFGLSSILPKLAGVELTFALALFGAIVLFILYISILSCLNIRKP